MSDSPKRDDERDIKLYRSVQEEKELALFYLKIRLAIAIPALLFGFYMIWRYS